MLDFLNDKNIIPEKSYFSTSYGNIGFSPLDNKWYGWTPNGYHGYGIGYVVRPGDLIYKPSSPEDLIYNYANLYPYLIPEERLKRRSECSILQDRSGIKVSPVRQYGVAYSDKIADAIDKGWMDPSKDLPIVKIVEPYIIKCGRGQWAAHTLDDCKVMAIEFVNATL